MASVNFRLIDTSAAEFRSRRQPEERRAAAARPTEMYGRRRISRRAAALVKNRAAVRLYYSGLCGLLTITKTVSLLLRSALTVAYYLSVRSKTAFQYHCWSVCL